MITRATVVIAILLLASIASAHPGHGVPGSEFHFAHYLLEPIHGAGMLSGLLAALAAALLLRARRSLRHEAAASRR